ncbi:MAG: hypothetical protein IK065_03875, partial [Neisseriaceae bacterium]|nr:hypothetical protein [Neisseriaceae bacterium]
QAEQFKQDWQVVQHMNNTSTGFSGTLFKNTKNNELVISFRSTEFVEDQLRDSVATNTLEITKVGWAMGQIADMEAWFNTLKSKGVIGENQKITVTGYSLGGHLATAFHILHSEQIDKTLTFNGAGVGSIGGDELTTANELQNMIVTFNKYKVNDKNIVADEYFSDMKDLKDLYNEIRAKLSYGLLSAKEDNELGTKDNISIYIQELKNAREILFEYKQDYRVSNGVTSAEYPQGVSYLEDTLIRLLEIAEEYQRIDTMNLPKDKKPYMAPIDYIEALKFDYQMAVLLTKEKHNTEAYIWTGATEIVSNSLDIVDSSPNIYNIKAGTYPSMTAVSQKHYGKEIDIAIENQPLFRGDERMNIFKGSIAEWGMRIKLHEDYETSAFGDTHSLVLIVDSLSVQSLFEQLDSTFKDNGDFNQILKLSTNQCGALDKNNATNLLMLSPSLEEQVKKAENTPNEQGLAEGDALENIVNSIAKMLGIELEKELKGNPNGNTWHIINNEEEYTGREDLHKAIVKISKAIEEKQLQGKLTVQSCLRLKESGVPFDSNGFIDGFDPKTNFTDFLAIYTLSPFTLSSKEDNLLEDYWKSNEEIAEIYEQWQKDKDAVDKGEERIYFSELYIKQRSFMLERKMVADYKNEDYKDAINSYNYYKDNTSKLELGEDTTNAFNRNKGKVIFGKDEDAPETLTGSNESDSLFGGIGDDTLMGYEGADYLEGGTGNDKYFIQGTDIVFDSDMKGSIRFEAGVSASPIVVGELIKIGEVKDKEGKIIKETWQSADQKVSAYKQDNNDLLITYKDHQVIVRRFFELVQKDNNGEYQGLGITLKTTD